jgi:hypothetical protein
MSDSSGPDLFSQGLSYFKSGKYEEALDIFQELTEKDDSNHKAWNALGVTLAKMGEHDSARICFHNALVYDPDNATYKKNLEKLEPEEKPRKKLLKKPAVKTVVKPAVKPAVKKEGIPAKKKSVLPAAPPVPGPAPGKAPEKRPTRPLTVYIYLLGGMFLVLLLFTIIIVFFTGQHLTAIPALQPVPTEGPRPTPAITPAETFITPVPTLTMITPSPVLAPSGPAAEPAIQPAGGGQNLSNQSVPAPGATVLPSGASATTEVCNCSGYYYNCGDFPLPGGVTAQQCYDSCVSRGMGDIHGLQPDANGSVCQ